MRKPNNIDDYRQCVAIDQERTMIFCVECNAWHTIEMVVMARVKFTYHGISEVEFDRNTTKFYCHVCGADVEYLLEGRRDEVVEQLAYRWKRS